MKLFNKEHWNEIFEVLTSNWVRTLMTAFGVFWGIFILIILLSSAKGLELGIRKGFNNIATNTLFIWTEVTTKEYQGTKKGQSFMLKNSDVDILKKNIQGIRILSPRNRMGGFNGGTNVVRGTNVGVFDVYGDYPEFIEQEPMNIVKGRFLNYMDIKQKEKHCVIGKSVINKLYDEDENPIGTYIKIYGINFKVVGVYKKSSQNDTSAQSRIFIPFTTFQRAFNYGDKLGWMAITAEDEMPVTKLKSRIMTILKKNHKIHPEDDSAIGSFDLYKEFKKINMLFLTLKLAGYIVGLLILISGVIGISNIMLIVVKERTKEIGIKRALGAKPREIRGQIILESLFLTIVAGILGINFAAFLLYIVNSILDGMPSDNDIMFANPSVSLPTLFVAFLILTLSGIFAGLIPAQTALKIKPIDALRDD